MTPEKPPRMPSKESVIKYKTAVWIARGGIRHMKNGKLVPFRESVRHRKCLQSDANDDIPATKIIMKGAKNNSFYFCLWNCIIAVPFSLTFLRLPLYIR